MSSMVEFGEFVSKNEDARKALEALAADFKSLDKRERALEIVKFAEKYGFSVAEVPEMEELSEDELEAVAGGKCALTDCGAEYISAWAAGCGFIAAWAGL